MLIGRVELIKKVDLENHDSLNQPATCGQGIDSFDLAELYANGNDRVTNFSFMKNLNILDATDVCGIDQNGISGLDLHELNFYQNHKIKHVSFMKKLLTFPL
jgi:hypothetical protein